MQLIIVLIMFQHPCTWSQLFFILGIMPRENRLHLSFFQQHFYTWRLLPWLPLPLTRMNTPSSFDLCSQVIFFRYSVFLTILLQTFSHCPLLLHEHEIVIFICVQLRAKKKMEQTSNKSIHQRSLSPSLVFNDTTEKWAKENYGSVLPCGSLHTERLCLEEQHDPSFQKC